MILKAQSLVKSYAAGSESLRVLDGVNFSLGAGESVAIMGPSGSGKSTLLQILGLMMPPDTGSLEFRGKSVKDLSDEELSRLRRRELGFVFQRFNLLPTLNARENVAWPLLLDGRPRKEAFARADLLLQRVGIAQRAGHGPAQLSGGEQQRVAIARALAAKPPIVFADEPTGALDSKNGTLILELLHASVLEEDAALVMVTHDAAAAATCRRLVRLRDGREC